MILNFKPQFPNKILECTKIHTIREDKHNRWRADRTIHFTVNARTKQQNCFLLRKCTSVQNIYIYWCDTTVTIVIDNICLCVFNVAASHSEYNNNGYNNLKTLAINDGFDNVTEFLCWFNKDFEGKIIHWTNGRY